MSKETVKFGRHHWWPTVVAKHWATGTETKVNRLLPSGTLKQIHPKANAKLPDGHAIVFDDPDTPWNSSFEPEFDKADNNFNKFISWLQEAVKAIEPSSPTYGQFIRFNISNEMLDIMAECISSLVVRSPQFRNKARLIVEAYRGSVSERELKRLIPANIQHSQKHLVNLIKKRGKFALIHCKDSELIFGDGFYQTFSPPVFMPTDGKLFVPITPDIGVIYVSPSHYKIEPRMVIYQANINETKLLNHSIQVYSKDYIFYKTEMPEVDECFACGEHLEYAGENFVDHLISRIPGIHKYKY